MEKIYAAKTEESFSNPGDPTPADLMEFIPWAALKLGVTAPLNISRKTQIIPVTRGKKSVKELRPEKAIDLTIRPDRLSDSSNDSIVAKNAISLVLTYIGEDLTHILFEKNKLPREVLKIIQMVLDFCPFLNGITVNCRIDKYTAYELTKILTMSHVTEICLDGTFVAEANYALLLSEPTCLQILSLSRCQIGDHVVKEISELLHYPLPASKKLTSLNLSSNRLTDKSAINLATALRTNRKLAYLNIASNMITDKGGKAILDVFKPFPITAEEQLDYRQRYMDYLKLKQTMIEDYVANFKSGGEKKVMNQKKDKRSTVLLKKREEALTSSIWYDRAENMVHTHLGDFEDPFNESFIKNDWRYLWGNNSLLYLNIQYNSLSHCFLKMLVQVLQAQQLDSRRFKGLSNIRLEGNPFPEACTELEQIEAYLDYGLSLYALKKGSLYSKKTKLKT